MANDSPIQIEAEVEGVAPLMMHNGRLANPLDPYTKALKELTSIKKKTDDVHEQVARAEFLGSLYHDPELGLFIPADMISASLIAGARKRKLGTAFESVVFVEEDSALDIGKKKMTPEQLWASNEFRDTRGAVLQGKRIMRTRPIFCAGWKVKFSATLLPDGGVNPSDIEQALVAAGRSSGFGDFRPRFGRFKVNRFKAVA